MESSNMIEKIDNNPLQFTCPICGSHELVLVEPHIVGWTVVQTNDSGELEYLNTIYERSEAWVDDCYFACGNHRDGTDLDCEFIPRDEHERIRDSASMLKWLRDHQQTPTTE